MRSYSSISPMYIDEISQEGTSGFFGSLNQIIIVIGMVFFDFIGPSLIYMDLNYIGAAICALQACLIWLVEESPAFDNLNKEEEEKSNEPIHLKMLHKLISQLIFYHIIMQLKS